MPVINRRQSQRAGERAKHSSVVSSKIDDRRAKQLTFTSAFGYLWDQISLHYNCKKTTHASENLQTFDASRVKRFRGKRIYTTMTVVKRCPSIYSLRHLSGGERRVKARGEERRGTWLKCLDHFVSWATWEKLNIQDTIEITSHCMTVVVINAYTLGQCAEGYFYLTPKMKGPYEEQRRRRRRMRSPTPPPLSLSLSSDAGEKNNERQERE